MKQLEPIRINKIALENFQAFSERIEISIKPLTFLFGPNSSGKSGILDSLRMVSAVFSDDDKVVHNNFRKWAHIKRQIDIDAKSKIEPMIIELGFSAWEFLIGGGHLLGLTESLPSEYWASNGLKEILANSEGPYDVKIEFIPTNFQGIDGGYDSTSLLNNVDITISANGLKLLKLFTPEDDDNHVIEFFTVAFGSMFSELSSRHNVNPFYKITCFSYSTSDGIKLLSIGDNEPYERDLLAIANHIFRCFSDANFLPSNVSSDRSTIKNEELSCVLGEGVFPNGGIPRNFLNAPIECVSAINQSVSQLILEICKSKFDQIINLKSKGSELQADHEYLHDFINRNLSQHLFIDQGYQIGFDICEIKPPSNKSVQDKFAALIVAYLIDNSGRKLTFNEVGTGISCALPVICAMHDLQSFIQQPELHLHPALQSALGDIFVEQANSENPGRYFIETHSDYLLLRCLRRIRETSNGKYPLDSKLRLRPEDISILYFEPQLDGATRIKKIRASTQGDFIDRWPRGFFEERGKDLFDE
jgi:predicted ATP-dependent endonuclease of OLD family